MRPLGYRQHPIVESRIIGIMVCGDLSVALIRASVLVDPVNLWPASLGPFQETLGTAIFQRGLHRRSPVFNLDGYIWERFFILLVISSCNLVSVTGRYIKHLLYRKGRVTVFFASKL